MRFTSGLRRANHIFVDLGLNEIFKEKARQTLKTHFGGAGQNDELIFATSLEKAEEESPGCRNEIRDFISSLLDWEQVQFIYLVAKMTNGRLSTPASSKKGRKKEEKSKDIGDRVRFLRNIAKMTSNEDRKQYLIDIRFFSPMSMDRLVFEIGKKTSSLLRKDWEESWQDFGQKADSLHAQLLNLIRK